MFRRQSKILVSPEIVAKAKQTAQHILETLGDLLDGNPSNKQELWAVVDELNDNMNVLDTMPKDFRVDDDENKVLAEKVLAAVKAISKIQQKYTTLVDTKIEVMSSKKQAASAEASVTDLRRALKAANEANSVLKDLYFEWRHKVEKGHGSALVRETGDKMLNLHIAVQDSARVIERDLRKAEAGDK